MDTSNMTDAEVRGLLKARGWRTDPEDGDYWWAPWQVSTFVGDEDNAPYDYGEAVEAMEQEEGKP